MRHHRIHHRRNVGIGQAGDMVIGGLSIIGGAVGSALLTEAVLGTSNVGAMGYAGNAAATAALATVAHMFIKNKKVRDGIIQGGVVQIILRALRENTPFGTYVSRLSGQLGVGDYGVGLYLPTNQVMPQRYTDAWNSAQVAIPDGWGGGAVVVNSSGANPAASGLNAWDGADNRGRRSRY